MSAPVILAPIEQGPIGLFGSYISSTIDTSGYIDVSYFRQLPNTKRQHIKHITSAGLQMIPLEEIANSPNLITLDDTIIVVMTPTSPGPRGIYGISDMLASLPNLINANFYIDPTYLTEEEQGYFASIRKTVSYYTGQYQPTEKYYPSIREVIYNFKDRPNSVFRVLWERFNPNNKSGVILSKHHFMYIGVNKTNNVLDMTDRLMNEFSNLTFVSPGTFLTTPLKQKYGSRVTGVFRFTQLLINDGLKWSLLDLVEKKQVYLTGNYDTFMQLPFAARQIFRAYGVDENTLRRAQERWEGGPVLLNDFVKYIVQTGILDLKVVNIVGFFSNGGEVKPPDANDFTIIVDFNRLGLYNIPDRDVDEQLYDEYSSVYMLSLVTGRIS